MTKASPFNGKWGLVYASNFDQLMDDWDMAHDYRVVVREAMRNYGPDRLVEQYCVDNEAGTISRKVIYKNEPGRSSVNIPFETFHVTAYFDGRPTRSYYGREGGRDNMIVRFEIGNNDKLHFMIVTEVNGDTMISTYTCRGRTYIKKFERIV